MSSFPIFESHLFCSVICYDIHCQNQDLQNYKDDKPKNYVRALSEREHLEIRFPVVEGYAFAPEKNEISVFPTNTTAYRISTSQTLLSDLPTVSTSFWRLKALNLTKFTPNTLLPDGGSPQSTIEVN